MSGKSVLLLMSGGVDSSAAGVILCERGYEVVGATMKQLDVEPSREMSGGCCSFGDTRDAKRVASALGIPHYTVNTAEEFNKRVILPFIQSYQAGLTPNPCVRCNSFVRYEEAFELARQWGCQYVATGHYARLYQDENGEPRLFRARNREKDQSYYLYGVRKTLLRNILFPLGDKTKDEVREIARGFGLVTAEKPESQDICFTLGKSYNNFLAQHIEDRPGDILDRQGRALGRHHGLTRYTVGQRRGLGLSGGPFYVCALDTARNAVIVGTKAELGKTEVRAASARWLHQPAIGERVLGQIRSRHEPAPATVVQMNGSQFSLTFDDPQFGVAPGQALVISRDDEIVGGGTILGESRHEAEG